MAAAHDHKEVSGLPAAALFAPVPDRVAIAELLSDGAQAACSRAQQLCPSFGLGIKLNESGPNKDYGQGEEDALFAVCIDPGGSTTEKRPPVTMPAAA